MKPVTIAVLTLDPDLYTFCPKLFIPGISSPGANVFGLLINKFFWYVAGPLDERFNILNTSLVDAPTVMSSGKFPGKLIVP